MRKILSNQKCLMIYILSASFPIPNDNMITRVSVNSNRMVLVIDLVFVDAKNSNLVKLWELGHQDEQQCSDVENKVERIVFGVEGG